VFTAQQFRPDCVVTDVVMPGRNGIDTAVAIVKSLPECKILLLSGRASADELLRSAARGLRWELLEKPISPEELLAHIAALLGNKTVPSKRGAAAT
jgi:DNA-binding response OmpR family regulator